MRVEKPQINSISHEHLTVYGAPRTKKQRMRDAIIRKDPENNSKTVKIFDAPEPSDEEVSQYNNWLVDFQGDIERIVKSKRFNTHLLSQEEVVSEVNMSLINKRKDLIQYMKDNGGFDYQNFKKSAFVYTRNLTRWSHGTLMNKAYVKRRDNSFYYDEDKEDYSTAFEWAVSTKGSNPEDNPHHFINSEQIASISNFYEVVKKYYNILSSSEVKVLSMLEKGLSEKEMSEKLDITRQAVNYCIKNLSAKINAHLNFDDANASHFEQVIEGRDSIDLIFSPDPNSNRIKESHSTYLQEFIVFNPKKFRLKDVTNHINKKFKTSYTTKQICTSLNMRKLYHNHIIKD